MAAEDEIGYPVKRPAPHAMDVLAAGERLDPPQHLAGRAVCKCSKQDPLRRNTLLDQIRNAVRDRPRLPAARTGNDQGGLRFGGNNSETARR